MSSPETLRVAVIGSGPAGIYTADALTRQNREHVAVDVLDRLPTPYGLVRYGVAPDHTKIKGVARALRTVLEHPRVRFLGGVEYGRHVGLEDLRGAYHAVVFATGAPTDRRMGVPGEDLPGSVAATDFVNWYCGHPDTEVERFLLDAEEAAVVGAGNVALDVARMLAKSADELRATDVPQPMLDVLAASKVRRINVVARRGPLHAKFTAPELRDIGELANADAVVDPAEVAIDPNGEEMLGAARAARTNLRYLKEWAERSAEGRPREVRFRFWRRPVRLNGAERVQSLTVERTVLDADGRLQGTGETEELPAGMVFRSIGYQGLPLPDLPFDEGGATVPHHEGRVVDAAGERVAGAYVAGWIKRGATGVIGTNKSDAAATVRSLLGDADLLREGGGPREHPDALLERSGAEVNGYEGWLAIDAAEAALADRLGRGDRVKLLGWDEFRRAARG
ncbi:FAD-dependent oxidoreductase [Nocardiopsis suaedae]|uniref:ferredoxin--NADP(+) reductase n=1 Tax=Nocardiopsis suaedae TaxID=3018444 RepID=A0ABT4TV86_9ACTN|nr:FAD-dependent oxidoreductase [Nocardiopsis suaedae]MDA2808622.1 FAD-dependent oxidoreductase [Nocardiopsis suaedae]